MTFRTLRASVDGAIGELVLDRPGVLNALSHESLGELVDAARWFDEKPAIKAVLIRGEGRAFCAGADLGSVAAGGVPGAAPRDESSKDDEEARRQALDIGRRMAEAIGNMRAMTVVAIHGHCVGGGVVLASACDIRLAAEGTRFCIPEVDLGIPLSWSGIPRLVREIGPAMTKELVLTCRAFDAREAKEIRFLNRVVPAHELLEQAREVVAKLATQPAYSLTLTKRHINAVAEEAGSTSHSFWESEMLLGAMRDQDSRDATTRYLQRRAR
jgi:enoyl-CoA hydratase/carnithine racemase